MSQESKSIKKTDDSAMSLLFDILGDEASKVADIDSYYHLKKGYIFLEFLKIETNIETFEPNENWQILKDKIGIVWEFAKKAEGFLWLVAYNPGKSVFKLFKVFSADSEYITFSKRLNFSFDEFKKWFQLLNSEVLKS
jgi:hypothetical protein